MKSPLDKDYISPSKQHKIGREYPPQGEQEALAGIIENLTSEIIKVYPRGEMLRQAHPKMHGCLEAEFEVLPNLPEHLQEGIFKEPKTFKAYIRFSNASRGIKPDGKKDIRGMGIKLVDVPGEKLLETFPKQQDFICISHDVFVAENVQKFSKTIKAIGKGKLGLLLYLLNPLHFGVFKRVMQSMKKIDHLLNTSFFSTTPYQFGSLDKAVKYAVIPASSHSVNTTKGEDFLRVNLANSLANEEAIFDFKVQLQGDAYKMPIEDPTKPWESILETVAKVRIPKQQFDSDEKNEFGEKLSYNPWHALPAHRPLGGINRARKVVYTTMYNLRAKRNNF